MNENIKRNPIDSTSIFEDRSIENDYRTLISLLKPGMRILDVGCGTGSITRGLLKYIGDKGYAMGIDSEAAFIKTAQLKSQMLNNLKFIHRSLFSFETQEKFDLVIAARTLQWIPDAKLAIAKMKQVLKPGGYLSILDYDHLKIEWTPAIPTAMQVAYEAFLTWRFESGLNNQISEDLPEYFEATNFTNIQVFEANEIYEKNQPNFNSKLGIWDKVVSLPQILEGGYLDKAALKQALQDYENWKRNDARQMVMKLKEIRGKRL